MKALVNKIIPFSSVDGEGNRTAIFFQGCNLNCSYCHNRETINFCFNCKKCLNQCTKNAITEKNGEIFWDEKKCIHCDSCIKLCPNKSTPKTKTYSVEELIAEIKEYWDFVSGITVSGGECTLWSDFITELFKAIKKEGLTAYIDSNGYKSFKLMDNLLEVSDGVMLDVKAWDEDIHRKEIGRENITIKENLQYLLDKNKLLEVRTVIVPDRFNNKETVDEVSKIISESNPNVKYKLIKFRNHGVQENMKNIKSPSDEYMESCKEIALKNGCKNIIIT